MLHYAFATTLNDHYESRRGVIVATITSDLHLGCLPFWAETLNDV